MIKHALLIDGEFGFASGFSQTDTSIEWVPEYSIKRRKLIEFESESHKPLDYFNAYSSVMQRWEASMLKIMEQEDPKRFAVNTLLKESPGWLRLTIVRSWSNEVEERD